MIIEKRSRWFRYGALLFLFVSLASVASAQGAPPRDSDGDGVDNSVDRCVDAPGPASNFGCPLPDPTSEPPREIPPDSDGDGTADPLDQCPTVFGNGANGGCPLDSTVPPTEEPAQPPFILVALPSDGPCVVSPEGAFGVNVRQIPDPESPALGLLNPNEIEPVLGILYGENIPVPRAETERGNQEGSEFPTWILIGDDDGTGWVAEDVTRLGGDCSEFDDEDEDEHDGYFVIKMRDVLVSSMHVGVNGELVFEDDYFRFGNFIQMPLDPTNPIILDVVAPDGGGTPELPEIAQPESDCEYVSPEAGVFILDCSESVPVIIECVTEVGAEAGMFVEVCYEVELPDNCAFTSPEAGVWIIECEPTLPWQIVIEPQNPDFPLLDVLYDPDDGTVLIGLLLPAVQKVR